MRPPSFLRHRPVSSLLPSRVALVSFGLLLLGGAAACDVPTPLAPAAPIGEVPKWGDGFATPSQIQGGSMMGPAMGGGGGAELGNTGLPAGTQAPGAVASMSGGDPALGKGLYLTMCAKCHGESGEGGQVPGGAMATALNDPKWQAATEDRIIARTVMLGKGAMPSFMTQGLDKAKLSGIVAYVRTLNASAGSSQTRRPEKAP